MSSDSVAFTSPAPLCTRHSRGSPILASTTRKHISPWRASASNDAPLGSTPGEDSDPTQDSISAAKSSFERMFKLDLQPTSESANGRCTCLWCNGSGERVCAWCSGAGSREEFAPQTWDEIGRSIEIAADGSPVPLPEKIPVVCSACRGSKKLRCAYCRGSGIGSYGHAY